MFRNGAGLRIFAFGLMLLGFCVFAWGLKYKLSLYDPPHAASHQMLAAKLLTGKKRYTLPAVELRPTANPDTPLDYGTLVLAFLVLLSEGVWPGLRRWDSLRISRAHAASYVRSAPAFVRPPPRIR